MTKILVLNGPNLNLLGKREKEHYGSDTLEDIQTKMLTLAKELNHELSFFQSNAEHLLIERIHTAQEQFIIFNPAAFTHTSIALRDALLAIGIPFIEVHLSDITQREEFRKHSYFSDIAVKVISGLGSEGYLLALHHVNHYKN